MRITIEIILISACFILISQPTVSWPPFKIHFDKPLLAIGCFLIMVGIVFIILQGHTEAYSRGLKKGCEIEHEAAIEAARQIINESKTK